MLGDHSWMLEVLKDMKEYSDKNELFQSQAAFEQILPMVEKEICLDRDDQELRQANGPKLVLVK